MSKITISSRNALEHVHVRQRGSKWSYRFEKAKVDGKRQTVERSGFARPTKTTSTASARAIRRT